MSHKKKTIQEHFYEIQREREKREKFDVGFPRIKKGYI